MWVSEQVKALPEVLTYSPLQIPLTGHEANPNLTLVKRDLFDARFQLISQDDGSEVNNEHREPGVKNESMLNETRESALSFLDTPSDLVPGVYEGGLKTWECSLDLVDYLECTMRSGNKEGHWMRGKKTLEVSSSELFAPVQSRFPTNCPLTRRLDVERLSRAFTYCMGYSLTHLMPIFRPRRSKELRHYFICKTTTAPS